MNSIEANDQVSTKDNRLNSSQPFLSSNNPIHTDNMILNSDVKAIKELSFPATSESSTISSTSYKILLDNHSLEYDLESSDTDFSPLLSSSEYGKIEEFVLNVEDDEINDINLNMMKLSLNKKLDVINNNNDYNNNNDNNNNNNGDDNTSEKSTDNSFGEPSEDSFEGMIKEKDDDNNQQLAPSISNTLEINKAVIDNVVKQNNKDFLSISNTFANIEKKFKEIENKINNKAKSISEPQKCIHQLLPGAVNAIPLQSSPQANPPLSPFLRRSSGPLPEEETFSNEIMNKFTDKTFLRNFNMFVNEKSTSHSRSRRLSDEVLVDSSCGGVEKVFKTPVCQSPPGSNE
jgi:hypothetical protein